MKSAIEHLKMNPKRFLVVEVFLKQTLARYSIICGHWYLFSGGTCLWKKTRATPVKVFRALTTKYLKDMETQLTAVNFIQNGGFEEHLDCVKRVIELVDKDDYVRSCLKFAVDLDYFWENYHFGALMDTRALHMGCKDGSLFSLIDMKFLKDPEVTKQLYIANRSGIDSKHPEAMRFTGMPPSFAQAIGYSMLSGAPPTLEQISKRAVLQVAGQGALEFVRWFAKAIGGDYMMNCKSLAEIPKKINPKVVRCLFLELDLTTHIPSFIRDLEKKNVHALVVLVTPSDRTHLGGGVDSYYEPAVVCEDTPKSDCLSSNTFEFLLQGYNEYMRNGGFIIPEQVEPADQVAKVLRDFLSESGMAPSNKGRAKMALARLVDILENRAKEAGYIELKVNQKQLQPTLRRMGFKLVNCKGTRYMKYTATTKPL